MGSCHCIENSDSHHLSEELDAVSIQTNADITAHMQNAEEIDNQTRKLLLLGAGSSGKSTLLKQLKYLYIYERGYPQDELLKYRNIVYENLIAILSTICKNCTKFQYETKEENTENIEKLRRAEVKSSLIGFETNNELKGCLLSVWNDKAIKLTFERRHEYILMDNAIYFLENIQRILSDNYQPTFKDIVYTRSVTTGITCCDFVFETRKGVKERYELVDVGGQRTERKKWISCFESTLAILFCISLNGWDQVLWEDNTVNKFEEAMNLLYKMCNDKKYKPLRKAKFIIFLNKHDLFVEKLKKKPFIYKDQFGPCQSEDEVIKWIKSEITNFDIDRQFYFNVTCATGNLYNVYIIYIFLTNAILRIYIDTEDVDRVFQICHDIVIRNAIQRGGFL